MIFYTYDTTTYETIDISEQKLTNAIIDTTIAKKATCILFNRT